MFWIWLIGVIIIGGVSAYFTGKHNVDVEEYFWLIASLTVFWPIVLGIAIVSVPFIIPYAIGVRAKKKLLKEDK